MPEFLSEIWLHDLDLAVQGSAGVRALAPIVIEQVVNDVPGAGQVRYQFRIDADGARVTVGDDVPGAVVDVRLTTDYATAVWIATGRENAQIALSGGRLRLGGNIDTLVRRADALGALEDATAELRAGTTYPSP